MFNNKRGISPLVATILLIAFAVSIGALIMNWSSSTEISGHKIIDTSNCAAVEIEVLSSCQNDNEIVLSLKNKGSNTINNIILKSGNNNYIIDSSILAGSENKVFYIAKSSFSSLDFTIVPVIMYEGNELVCISKTYDQVILVDC